MPTARFFLGYDNTVKITALDDEVAADISAATEIIIDIGNLAFNSVDDPGLFDLSDLANGNVILKLGASGVSQGAYLVRFITKDVTHPNGLVWADPTDADAAILHFVPEY